MYQGLETNIIPVYWRSGKIERTCRSPACAETIVSLNGEDDLTYLRILWAEMRRLPVQSLSVDTASQQTPGYLITDSRNLFDRIIRATPVIKGAEKRSSIESLSLRENLERGHGELLWVNGQAMLANSLTKTQEKSQLMLYVHMGFRRKIVYDEEMMSGKKRAKLGLGPLEARASAHTHNKRNRRTEELLFGWAPCGSAVSVGDF